MSYPRRLAQLAAIVLWGAGIACGLAYALVYEQTPTENQSAPDHWPAESACAPPKTRPKLVMFVHPHCPCSRASLEELAVLMTHCGDRLDAQVLFFSPPSAPSDWPNTDLWDSAARIPGVTVGVDTNGLEERHFSASVSGETYVYLPDGKLQFHGGITAGRGHIGDNTGRSSLESFLLRDEAAAPTTPVYGCALRAAACDARPATAAEKGTDQ